MRIKNQPNTDADLRRANEKARLWAESDTAWHLTLLRVETPPTSGTFNSALRSFAPKHEPPYKFPEDDAPVAYWTGSRFMDLTDGATVSIGDPLPGPLGH